jgi:hypothetical protein
MLKKRLAVLIAICLAGCTAKTPEAAEAVFAENTESTTTNTVLSTFEIETAAPFVIAKAPETEVITELTENSETTAEKPTLGFYKPVEDEMDKNVTELFEAFVNHDKEELKRLTSAKSDGIFDFVDDITFGDYEITPGGIHVGNGSLRKKEYSIKLEVKESSDPRFPVGENTYKINTLDAGVGPRFSPLTLIDEPEKLKMGDLIITEDDLRKNANICYFFTVEMQPFYGRKSTDSFEISADETVWFYSCMRRFFSHVVVGAGSEFTPDEMNAAAKSILGIDAAFDETNINPLWYGAHFTDAVLVSEDENSVVIDWYADCLLFEKAFTMKYKFDTTDGFRLLSVENLYDSGLAQTSYTT